MLGQLTVMGILLRPEEKEGEGKKERKKERDRKE
jgi:hypothetical protein